MMPVMGDVMKICTVCNVEKELNLFKNDNRRKDKKSSWCKECHKNKNLEYSLKYKHTPSLVSQKKLLKESGFKKCQVCSQIKLLDNFYKKYKDEKRNARASSCKSCMANVRIESPEVIKGYKHKYKNKLSLKKYYEINKDFHCLKICHTHGMLTYKDIGVRQRFSKSKNKSIPSLYCLLCHKTYREAQHNEERRLRIMNNNENVICVTCQKDLHHSGFSASNLRSLYPSCKKCRFYLYRKYEENRMMIKRYGFHITSKEYNELLIKQKNVCAICGGKDKNKKLAIDHCHKSIKEGVIKIRGLLCQRCNLSIGAFEDNIKLLNLAIKYLEDNA